MKRSCQLLGLMTLLLTSLLFGCSGGDDGEIVGTGLSGKAAVGDPIKQGTVTLKATSGEKITTTTGDSGEFAFSYEEIKNLTGPYVLRVKDDNDKSLYSISHHDPESKVPGISNLHPLSNVVTRNWFSSEGRELEVEFEDNNAFSNPPEETDIEAIVEALRRLLAFSFNGFSIVNDFNLIHSDFNTNGEGFDKLLDYTSIKFANNEITIRIKDPDSNFEATIIFNFSMSINLATVDTTPPSIPSSVLVLPASDTGIFLVWNSSEDNIGIAGYNVYRNDQPNQILYTTPYPVYVDTGLTSGNYCYQIEAVDGSGNPSEKSAEVCTNTLVDPDTTPPEIILGVTATASSDTIINLTWDVAPELDIIGYDVLRGVAGMTPTKFATVVANKYENFGLTELTEYCYIIRAFDAAANRSVDSAQVCATTPTIPDPVTTATPGGGTYNTAQSVSLTCVDSTTANCANIYYTTNGDNPTIASTVYSGAIAINSTTTLKFFGRDSADNRESVKTETYTIVNAALPVTTATPGTGTYNTAQNVTLSCLDGTGASCFMIHYTTNGDEPTMDSTQYSAPINISSTTTLKFFGMDDVGNNEVVKTETYTIDEIAPVTTATPGTGTYTSTQPVTLNCTDVSGSGCATTYYTTDGTDPTISTTAVTYSGAINISTTTTLQFYSVDNAGNSEAFVTADYIINPPTPLALNVSVLNENVVSGGKVTYLITISNMQDVPATGVSVSYTVPNSIDFLSTIDTQPNSSACGNSSCTNGEVATWSLGDFSAGESRTIELNANVATGLLDDAVITADISANATSLSTVNVSKSVSVLNSPLSLLALSASKDPIKPGESYTYSLDIGNVSVIDLDNLQLRLTLPSNLTITNISNNGSQDVISGDIVWDIATVAVGTATSRQITVTAPAVIAGEILSARAELIHAVGIGSNIASEYPVTVVADSVTQPFPLDVKVVTNTNPVVAGDRLLYEITVSNTSSVPLNDVAVQYRVPAGISFLTNVDAAPDSSACGNSSCTAGEEAEWSFTIPLAAKETRTIHLNATVDANLANGKLISSLIRVGAPTLGDTIELLKTTQVYNNPLSQLAISASKDPVLPNEIFSYTVDVGNISTVDLSNVQLTLKVPEEVTVDTTSITDNGIYDSVAGTINWSIASQAVETTIQRQIRVTATGAAAGDILAATALVTHDGGTVVDGKAEHTATVVAQSLTQPFPLSLEVATASNPAVAGDRLLYEITVSNTSAVQVDAVEINFRVPTGLSFLSNGDVTPDSSSCGNSNCTAGEQAFWALGALKAKETRTIHINAQVAVDVKSGSLISASIRLTATELKDTMELVKTVQIYNTPSVQFSMSSSKDPILPGDTFMYSVDTGNISVVELTGVELRMQLPAGLTINSISDSGTEDLTTGEIVWGPISLPAQTAINRQVTVTANSVAASDILLAKAQLVHDGGAVVDARTEQSVAVGIDSLTGPFPLDVSVTTRSNPVSAGERLFYDLKVSNTLAVPVTGVEVKFRAPVGISFYSNNDAEPNSSNCVNTICTAGEQATWTLGTLAAKETRTIHINAIVDTGLTSGTLISAPIRVTYTDFSHHINLIKTVHVYNTPSVQLVMAPSVDPIIPNDSFTYDIAIGNISIADVTGMTLTMSVPAGLTVDEATIPDSGTYDSVAGEISWPAVNVLAGGNVQRRINVTASNVIAGKVLTAKAWLSHDGGMEVDASAESTMAIAAARPELSLTITGLPNSVVSGSIDGTMTYTFNIVNNLTVAVDGVTVQYRVPKGLQFFNTAAQPNSSACVNTICTEGEEALWSIGAIPGSGSSTITLVATVLANQVSGTLISAPIRYSSTNMTGVGNLQSTVVVNNN